MMFSMLFRDVVRGLLHRMTVAATTWRGAISSSMRQQVQRAPAVAGTSKDWTA